MRIPGSVTVTICAGRPDRAVATSTLFRTLTAHRLIEDDDAEVASLSSRRDGTVAPGRISSTVTAATRRRSCR
jgi:hypothetical protein